MRKILVAYFSATGTTKKVAEKFGGMRKVIAYLWSTKRDARSVLIDMAKEGRSSLLT